MAGEGYDAACPKFRESYDLDPAPGALLNLADCEEKRGRVATAWSIFRQLARDLPANDDRRPIAQSRAAALEARVPRLTIRLAPGAPADTAVQRAGVPVGAGSLDSPLPVDPGEVQVTAAAPGRKQKIFTVQLAEGAQIELLVAPEEAAAAAGAGPALPPKAAPQEAGLAPADGRLDQRRRRRGRDRPRRRVRGARDWGRRATPRRTATRTTFARIRGLSWRSRA